ncbi:MAG TPA: NAD(P)-binding domain-containing protein, partial [Actinomycetota bacterium]|nr:NAD(P)-binding domain-containing protein [Actinomycetota bacterium]
MSIELGVEPLSELAERIRSKRARVGVVGLGYVGLPLLIAAETAGFETLGFDVDHEKIEQLRSGRSYIVDVSDSEVESAEFGEFSSDPAILSRAHVIVICVPTPLTDRTPDLSMVRTAAEMVGRHLQPGRLVILESTTYPGTTEEVVRPILEATSGLEAGQDFALG